MSLDPTRAASTIEQYAADLHQNMLDALQHDEAAQLQYLREILERPHPDDNGQELPQPSPKPSFIEQYVRLLCDYQPHRVSEYIGHLNAGDLRLEEVMPALENRGVVDAAIVLLAREGKVREGIDRLTRHINFVKAALLGLLDGAQQSPDAGNTAETAQDLVESVQKYARVGIWICREQTKSARHSKAEIKQPRKSNDSKGDLSIDESLWLALIDAVVSLTKDVTEVLEKCSYEIEEREINGTQEAEAGFGRSKLITQLRTVVQETFTALLSTTSAPRTNDIRHTDASFLRIFQAFLSHASSASSSLSNLRSVLGAIFSAYSYEESLLALANRLLDKDLFVHVTEANTLRRRGWRPLGQVCEGCSKRVWGPGAGPHIWEAWQRKIEERSTSTQATGSATEVESEHSPLRVGKGKGAASKAQVGETEGTEKETTTPDTAGKGDLGPVVIFACRHMFHQQCLEKMQGGKDNVGTNGTPGRPAQVPDLECPLCAES